MTRASRSLRGAARSGRRLTPRLPWLLGAAAGLCAVLFQLWRGLSGTGGYDASTPMTAGDLSVGPYRAGIEVKAVREQPVSSGEENGARILSLQGAVLRFTGSPPRLSGAEISAPEWAGPRGLRVGDPLEKLYKAIPVTAYEEQPDNFVLLYAKNISAGGLPEEPYAVLVPSGNALRVHLAARQEGGAAFAICDIYVDPDTNLIQRIAWEIAPEDDLLEQLE